MITKTPSGKMLTYAQCKIITKMTAENYHGEALQLGAKLIGANCVLEKLKLVNKLQELEGCLAPGLGEYRDSLYKEVMRHADQVLTNKEYEAFKGAF